MTFIVKLITVFGLVSHPNRGKIIVILIDRATLWFWVMRWIDRKGGVWLITCILP